MLVKELEIDARQSHLELAAKLETSPTTVRRRLQRLLDEGIITIIAMTDPIAFGFQTRAHIGLNVRPGKVDAVVEYLKSYRSVRVIRILTGRYDVFLSVIFRSSQEMLTFANQELGRIPDLVDYETMLILQRAKGSWTYLNDSTGMVTEAIPQSLDESSLKLIAELELHPRESITNLGHKLGMNRKSVSRRLQALLNENIVRVVSITNPSAFGFGVHAAILVKVYPGKITDVVEALVADTRIHLVTIITGNFDLFLAAAFQDAGQMADFLRNDLGNIDGVMTHETMLQVALPKRSFALMS